MVINQWPRLSPIFHAQYLNVAYFKGDFYNLHICVKKDALRTWHKFPYFVTEDDIMGVISKRPGDWLTPSDVETGASKAVEGEVAQTTTTTAVAAKKKKEA